MATKYDLSDNGVVAIIGSGAGGGTLANEMAQKGVNKIVILEAGKHFTAADFVNDEFASFSQLAWLDKRQTAGAWSVARTAPGFPAWHCKGVGGSTLAWSANSFRFQPHEFKIATTYGKIPAANMLDWPISYDELEPYYTLAEKKLGVSGLATSGMPKLPPSNMHKVAIALARGIGHSDVVQTQAINSIPHDGRPACRQAGFCFQGCKFDAKWSTMNCEIPKALATGRVELRPECMALQIQHDKTGKVTGVLYVDKDGKKQFQKARIVCVAGNSIETPRLLMNSATSKFPHGLANSSGQLGKNYMVHATCAPISIHKKPIRMYRGTAVGACIMDTKKHDPSRGFAGGYISVVLGLGLPFTAAFLKPPSGWGREIASAMEKYDYMIGSWLCGEQLPMEGNGVTLHPTEKDQHGLPIPIVSNSDHPNDAALVRHALANWIKMNEALGSTRTIDIPVWSSAHNLGTARMSANARDGVVDKWGRAHDIKNLFISDGSIFTSSACVNPTETIVALAIRQAHHIADQLAKNVV
jgi:choline dehydrogenase-like flavoprotein